MNRSFILNLFTFFFVVLENINYYFGGHISLAFNTLLISFLIFLYFKSSTYFNYLLIIIYSLSIGQWSYVLDDVTANTIYGIRILNFSILNILTIMSLLKRFKMNSVCLMLIFYILFITLLNHINKSPVQELLTFDLKFIIPIILIYSIIPSKNLTTILKAICRGILINFFFAFILENYYEYAPKNYFLIISSAAYLFIPILFTIHRHFKFIEKIILFCTYTFFIVNGSILLGGKVIVMFFICTLYLLTREKYVSFLLFSLFAVSSLFPIFALDFLNNHLFVDRLNQITSTVIDFDLEVLPFLPGSIGCIFAEIYTFIYSFQFSPLNHLFGFGLGEGLSDHFYFLYKWVNAGGFSLLHLTEDTYNRLHLTFLNIILKFGIIPFLFFFCFNFFKNKKVDYFRHIFILIIFFICGDANISNALVLFLLFKYNTHVQYKYI